ncbi:unnamed protein product [Clavelina lepadiformis]|uniref:Uncharacterized protein n=1 Tax=Clavelina lepadiformis TaxID=159417 RepID=A0ABP0F3J7_CLALP
MTVSVNLSSVDSIHIRRVGSSTPVGFWFYSEDCELGWFCSFFPYVAPDTEKAEVGPLKGANLQTVFFIFATTVKVGLSRRAYQL